MRTVYCLATVGAVLLVVGCTGPQPIPDTTPTVASPASSSTVSTSPSTAASPATSPADQPSAGPASDGPKNVPATLRFTSTKVDGGEFNGASLTGKPALIWFWAPWCPVCRSQIDQVQRIASDNEGKVNVVGVGSLDDAKAISGFAPDASLR